MSKDPRFLPPTPFSRLMLTHAVAMSADACVAVSLAGSLFFQKPGDSARGSVLLYLLLTRGPRRWAATGRSPGRCGRRRLVAEPEAVGLQPFGEPPGRQLLTSRLGGKGRAERLLQTASGVLTDPVAGRARDPLHARPLIAEAQKSLARGVEDSVVPVESVQKLVTKLSHQRDIKIDFRKIPGADHFFVDCAEILAGHVDAYIAAHAQFAAQAETAAVSGRGR